ncbi:hypothetical protein SCLCIDRAFT_31571 [Scleroderma citrinum Foug A]|uniref:Uncharacterized protein n=1 Tax=Scleroderma citrinum Foug A TaxID=1036808 RepID=A0A0C2YW20_9AGAM|nr:hypothetical protein SCLCIDRAFT_31571 [Scleroderma citrinum Foug A]
MAQKVQKAAAAHVHAVRLACYSISAPVSSSPPPVHSKTNQEQVEPPPNTEDDHDSCGYAGGVDYDCTDSEYELDSDCSEDDDSESVVELEGNELEQNLSRLRKELKELAKQTPYEKVVAASSMSVEKWRKADCSLGYTGTSQQTHQRWHTKVA